MGATWLRQLQRVRDMEVMMRRLFVLGASALLFASLVPDDASAQRGRGIGMGGVRVGAIGRPAIGGIGRVGIGGPGRWAGAGWVGRRVAWGGWRPGLRRAWWGFPVAAGLGFAAASTYAYDSCLAWDGWQWVNVCYQPSYGYYGYGW
jgi:hypothetical protein